MQIADLELVTDLLVDVHTHRHEHAHSLAIYSLKLEEIQNFSDSTPQSFVSAGIHPWDVHSVNKEILNRLEVLLADSRMLAIGECGLDRNAQANMDLQLEYFEHHISLSEKYAKPLIIHCVGAYSELLYIRKRIKPMQTWIIHGFRGKPELCRQLLKSGCAISYGEKMNENSVLITPIEKLFVETDESTIAVQDIYRKIARLKGCEISELNAGAKLFNFF